MTRSARAREVRALWLPRWLRVRGQHPARAALDTSESGVTTFDSDGFRSRVNASLGLQPDGEPETLSRWS
jgi:hypothetical protein